MKNIKQYIFIFLFLNLLSVLLYSCVTCTYKGDLVLTITFSEERERLCNMYINDTLPSNWFVSYSKCDVSVLNKIKEIKEYQWLSKIWDLRNMEETDTLDLLLYSHEKLLRYCKGEIPIESCYELYFFSRPYLEENNWHIHIDADTKQRYLY